MLRRFSRIATIAILLVASFSLVCPQESIPAPRMSRRSADEPFATFEELDKQLTRLLQLDADLGKSPRPMQTMIFAQMTSVLIDIERMASQLTESYKDEQQAFGVRIFGRLQSKARACRQAVDRVSPDRAVTARETRKHMLDLSIVALILQFQSSTAGFKAVRCTSKEFACCEPNSSDHRGIQEPLSCSWICVKSSVLCRGYLGPRLP